MLSRRWLSQRQGRAHTELAARKEHRPKTKAGPAVGVTITFAKRQTHITRDSTMGRPQVWSGGSIPGWLYTTGVGETSVFISRSRKIGRRQQQPNRTKELPAKKKPEKLLSPVSKRTQSDTGKEHPEPNRHQERSSNRLNKRARSPNPVRI